MTATRTLITVGEGAAASDIQRISDAAAYADDRAHEVIFTPNASGVQKRVVPLSNDTNTTLARLLVVPGTAAGTVRVMPARFIAGVAPYTIAAAFSSFAAVQSPAFANNPGAARTDLVYATLGFTTTTATRRSKLPSSGVTGSSPVAVEQHPALTVAIAQGNNLDGSPGVLPADTASTYNFPLALVALPGAYVNTTPITQPLIAQNYERSWIPPQRVGSMQPMSIFGSTQTNKSTTTQLASNSRWGGLCTFYGEWNHSIAGQSTVTVLDSTIDWSRRLIWGWAIFYGDSQPQKPGGVLGYVTNQITSDSRVRGIIPPFFNSGVGGTPQTFILDAGAVAADVTWALTVDPTTHALNVAQIGSTAPMHGAGGPNYYGIVLFCSDQFVF